jgi:glutathione S-transferase
MRLYDVIFSGNGYKVRLALAFLEIPYELVEVDILAGGSRTPQFLEKNPNGRVPVLELDDGTCLAESNAILFYLGEGTSLFPSDRLQRAQVLQWMFFEQYSHEPYVATSRFLLQHREQTEEVIADVARRRDAGLAALAVMERHLSGRQFFVGERFSIADVALYAYTHVAPEGGFSLDPYPRVREWLDRVRSQPRHVTMGEAG